MTDILIRDVPDDVIAAIDARAKRVGLSRTEYLRRALERERAGTAGPVGLADLTVLQLDKDFELIAELTGQPIERLELN